MRPESLEHLADIDQACAEIETFTAGKELEDYLADRALQAALERKFMIVE